MDVSADCIGGIVRIAHANQTRVRVDLHKDQVGKALNLNRVNLGDLHSLPPVVIGSQALLGKLLIILR